MLCPTCGAELPDDAAVCAECGAALDAQPAPEPVEAEASEAEAVVAEPEAVEELTEEPVEEPAEEAAEEVAEDSTEEAVEEVAPAPIPFVASPLAPVKKKGFGRLIVVAVAVIALVAAGVILFLNLGGEGPDKVAVKAMTADTMGDLLESTKYSFYNAEKRYNTDKEFRDGVNERFEATSFKECAEIYQEEYLAEMKAEYGEDVGVTFKALGVEYLKGDTLAAWLEESAPDAEYDEYCRCKWSAVKRAARVSMSGTLKGSEDEVEDEFDAYLVKSGSKWYFFTAE